MTQKLFCLCAVCALLLVFATANVASAQEVAPAACPCGVAVCPGKCFNPCCPPVAYRVGLFGAIRPVVCAPAYYAPAACYAPTYCAPVCRPPVYRPYWGPRCCPPVGCAPCAW